MNLNIPLKKLKKIETLTSFPEQVYKAALVYAKAGMAVIPLSPNSKVLPPKSHGLSYPQATTDPKTIKEWFHPNTGKHVGWNIGIPTGKEGGIMVLDVDRHGEKDGFITLKAKAQIHGRLPKTPTQKTPNKGKHLFYAYVAGVKSTASKLGEGLDTRGGTVTEFKGHVAVFPSSVQGISYQWETGGEVAKPPIWILEQLGISVNTADNAGLFAQSAPLWVVGGTDRGNENAIREAESQLLPLKQITKMLDFIDPNQVEYTDWLRLGMAVHSQDSTPNGLKVWDDWSSKGDRYTESECPKRWGGFDGAGGSQAGTLCFLAKEAGWKAELGDHFSDPTDAVVSELNQVYALVSTGSGYRILIETPPDEVVSSEEPLYALKEVNPWHGYMRNQTIMLTDANGKAKLTPKSRIWEAHCERRTFPKGIGLFPCKSTPSGWYNTWGGFTKEAIEGDCSLFLDHIENVICKGNKQFTGWVLDWMADVVQDAGNLKGTAIVVKGKEGCGKGLVAQALGRLMKRNYVHIIDPSHLTGKFNAHLANAVLVFADEIVWGGDVKSAGKLKGMVSERDVVVETKGVDATISRNCAHLIIASNGEWVVPAGDSSRRWMVLEVSDERCGDLDYFDNLHDQMEKGGDEALMFMLQNRKITSNLRRAPETDELLKQRALSHNAPNTIQWFARQVSIGSFDTPDEKHFDPENAGENTFPAKVNKAMFFDEYEQWCLRRHLRPVLPSQFVKYLTPLGVTPKRATATLGKTLALQPLDVVRELLVKHYPELAD